MRFRATLREMAASEIAEMIGSAKIEEIKARDPRPVFKAFVVGHEGEAQGNMVGVGNVVKRWFRAAVEKLHERISAGLQLFNGHAPTNDAAGRQAIGEVVGKKLMKIGDRLSSVVACYILPEFKHLPLDVASIEADVEMEMDRTRGLYIADVDAVTGIALGNSRVDTPGFEGATLLGQLQAFAKSHSKEQYMKPTADEIRNLIREAELQPSDLFEPKELTADPFVSERMKEKNASPESFYELRKLNKTLAETEKRLADSEKEKVALTEKVKAQDAAIAASHIESARGRVPTLFEKLKTERKLDDRQTKFIQARLARFVPSKPEEVEKEFNTFLDAEVDEYGKIAKDVFGVGGEDDKGKKGGSGSEPVKGPSGGGPENPYLDPAKNPMIKLS